ncbi:zinc finger CCCH domain-containing protein 6 [Coffea eugenioides]|uniref:zinc finger CCCH domain-containing protein 6 n=1 Tax=Coffea eugenioides TaxID=49369 RepID=UPI000F606C1F|nr:zinc finger CCCH domain-containing protein 6 [Coffea eugenioides]
MGGSQKSKRVRWPSDDNLCQVRLFLSEETPAQVGFGCQDHLQAKTSWSSNSNSLVSDDNLPPGFEGTQPANLLWNKLPQIPLIKWKCPPRFVLDDAWRVVAGEESVEVERENRRENTVLEAIYPRPSAIPPDPSTDAGAEISSDEPVTHIPITPIEDEDAPAPTNALFDSVTMNTLPLSLQSQPLTPGASSSHVTINHPQRAPATEVITGVDLDVVAAAHAALSAVMTNTNQGNMIDRDLLIKILSDPKMVEQLVKNHGSSTSTQTMPATSMQNVPTNMQHMASISTRMPVASMQNVPATAIPNIASTTTQSIPGPSMPNRPRPMTPGISLSDQSQISISRTDRPLAHISRPEVVAPPVTAASGGVFYPPSRIASISNMRPPVPDVVSAPSPSVGAPVAKDINYYKSLIQQHGGDRQEPMLHYNNRSNTPLLSAREPLNNPKSRDMKPKIMKPCMYFNSSRGCRNGANCAYQHDESSPQQRVNGMPDSQSAKRMKMDREITGT